MPAPRADRAPASTPDAFEIAVRLLGQRPHSEWELRRKLARQSCPVDEIERALVRARRLGYLDDAAFARALAARRARTRGPALIARELAAKGMESEVVREAIDGLHRAEVLAAARRLAGRAAAGGTDRRAVAARLLRRGFPGDVVREAVGRDVEPLPEVE